MAQLRTHILGKLLNSEIQDYLLENDVIIIPVGTTEMHGGFPVDCETVLSEAVGLKMAEACGGLVLTGLPYFYSGATSSGRGTVEIPVRVGIDYLGAIARSLLRQGFQRQIYISFHGPASLTIEPVIRDLFDETGASLLYMDSMKIMAKCRDLFTSMDLFHDMTMGAYKIMGRLEDIPLVTGYQHSDPPSAMKLFDLMNCGNVGYYFGENKDHMSTPDIPDEQTRSRLADSGEELICKMVDRLDMKKVVDQMRDLAAYNAKNEQKYPWIPSAWGKSRT